MDTCCIVQKTESVTENDYILTLKHSEKPFSYWYSQTVFTIKIPSEEKRMERDLCFGVEDAKTFASTKWVRTFYE